MTGQEAWLIDGQEARVEIGIGQGKGTGEREEGKSGTGRESRRAGERSG